MKEHLYLTGFELALGLRQQKRKQRQAHDLPNKALGRRHGNLFIGLGVNHAVGLARHRTTHHIGDAKDFSALDARIANRRQGICRLARLRHRNHERRGGDYRVAIPKLARRLDLTGNARPALNQVFGNQAGVVARSAGDHVNAVDQVELLKRKSQLIDIELTRGR